MRLEKKPAIALAICTYLGAALVLAYGSGFSWRQIGFGAIALFLCLAANEIQFRLELPHLDRRLKEAGISSEEEIWGARDRIYNEITGKGTVVFTWLEPSLFYINTMGYFSSSLSLTLSVPSFGGRAEKLFSHLPDVLEIRSGDDGYESVFLTSEQQYCWPDSARKKGRSPLRTVQGLPIWRTKVNGGNQRSTLRH